MRYGSRNELAHRVSKIRKKFAKQYGFVIPEIKLTDNLSIDAKGIVSVYSGKVDLGTGVSTVH